MTTLSTERLLLRPWRAADREPFAVLNGDAEVMRWFPAPLDRAESDALADRLAAQVDAVGWGRWAVEVQGDEPFVGFVGLAVPRFGAGFVPAVEIGWRLARPVWVRGLATEAAQAVVTHAFDALGLRALVSFTPVGNTRSRAVMQRIGMRHDPAGEFEHPLLPPESPLRRHVLYRLAR